MPWSMQGSLKGPQGDTGVPGSPGRGIVSSTINASGELVLTFSDSTTQNLGVVVGASGQDGKSVTIMGKVATSANLPVLTAADAGQGWIADDTGHLWVWDGAAWTDVGQIEGPAGPPGVQGDPGPRGATWFSGNGAPADPYPGALPGDHYLNLVDGTVYVLS